MERQQREAFVCRPVTMPPLRGLQPTAVKARYSAEETPLPADRTLLLNDIEVLANGLEARLQR